ncbi:NACHT, LRR and PYD domains-containing protein 3-like isoform X2 [Clupea harengus]|uniref:NACHT, LRR and PYD domains-containing protein 3-like isoform X2 n=1 Tax=Clupea harengus TaxID=7950 RepID=A0A6P8EPM7_CLUHA|nr:NACHT, LRR and PYD domains-containing protein 3-like isoform X2 [Clupea harengus]
MNQDVEEAAGHTKTLIPDSALHSCVTMKNDQDMDDPGNMSSTSTQTNAGPQTNRPPSPVPTCVSMKSDNSMRNHPDMSSGSAPSALKPQRKRPPSPVPSCVSMKSDTSMRNRPDMSSGSALSALNELRSDLTQDQSRCGLCEQVLRDPVITTCGHSFCRQCISSYWEQPGLPGGQSCPQCGKTRRTQHPLQPRLDEHTDMVEITKLGNEVLRRVIDKHKANLKRRFENISEGIIKPGAETPLNKIYTELYITEGESEGVNKEHEVWQVESASRTQTTEDTPIHCNDIFKPLPGQEKHIRTVMTKGVAGIGKTVSVQKFILDWTDGEGIQDVDFMFPLPFRELNLVRSDQYSLHKLLLDFHPELKELKNDEEYNNCQILFIFDGLDESRLPLNFQQSMISDFKQISSVDVLMTSLIQGTLLPSAHIWITSRPAAVSQIPAQRIDQITEVRGFNDPQKEEYFRKRISDESQASRIISHIKASRSLYIMCHIPVFCWIAATVLQQMLEQDNTQEIPRTLTEMFIHFLLIQITRKNQKYQSGKQTKKEQLPESQEEIILKLSKLSFKNLENGNVMFYEEDLRECGIDAIEASVYSGMCTEIFKEESVFHQRKVYCFVHLSIQEFLAALHIFVSYSNQMETMGTFFCLEESLKLAVTKVLESRNGHLDLFLRFLMGICMESNQRLLGGLLNHTHNRSESVKKMCQYIKELNKEDLSPERCISLLQCLSEVNDHSMHEEIQEYLKSPKGFRQKLSAAHCSALAHMLLMSEEVLDEFDLKKYNTSDEGRRRLLPAVRCYRKAQLDGCKLNQMSCETVKRSLQFAISLIQLDLSCNALGDSGVQILSAGLTSPHCKLQTLRLGDCKLSGESCEIVACVLQSVNSLAELDMGHNDLGDSGVRLLCKGLVSPYCELQILRLSGSLISEEGCGFLASALTSNPSHLKELDLSYNHPGESGLRLLSARLEDPHSKLETLNADHCAEIRLRPGARKYPCELTLDPNTAYRLLSLSEGNRKVTCVNEDQRYPDHPERFDRWYQVLSREGLSGRCYWEAEWSGGAAHIAVVYKSIQRKGSGDDCRLGYNDKSWSLYCSPGSYSAGHNNEHTDIPAPSSRSSTVGVYLDWPAGTLSFYSVSSDTLTHLHTFHSTFTEPLYPGFRSYSDSSVSLCQIT